MVTQIYLGNPSARWCDLDIVTGESGQTNVWLLLVQNLV